MKQPILASITIITAIACSSAQAVTAKLTDTSKPILLQKNQRVVDINLPSNPTTGYQWVLEGNYPTTLIQPVKETYTVSHKNLIGSGGIDHWQFKLSPLAMLVPTHLQLHFSYGRQWQKGNEKSLTIDIVS